MMPGRLGEMTDRIDHHQRAFPTVGAIFAADPAILQVPMGQIALEPLLNLLIRVGSVFFRFGHGGILRWLLGLGCQPAWNTAF
jgi:hypothetical protein